MNMHLFSLASIAETTHIIQCCRRLLAWEENSCIQIALDSWHLLPIVVCFFCYRNLASFSQLLESTWVKKESPIHKAQQKKTVKKIISCQKVILDTEGCAEIQRAKIVLFTKGCNFKIVFGQCANKRQVRLSRKYQLFQDNLERALSLSVSRAWYVSVLVSFNYI